MLITKAVQEEGLSSNAFAKLTIVVSPLAMSTRRTIEAQEGQVSITKDDTMVLVDDANAYWWLIRAVKTIL